MSEVTELKLLYWFVVFLLTFVPYVSEGWTRGERRIGAMVVFSVGAMLYIFARMIALAPAI